MADANQPANRKQRRAAARDAKKKGGEHMDQGAVGGIKLAQPDRSGPKAKTLLEIAEEKNALLEKGQPFPKSKAPPRPANGEGEGEGAAAAGDDDDPFGQVGDAILYSTTLTMLHFTLDVLVYNQYSQGIVWAEAFRRAAVAFPIMCVSVYMTHGETAAKFPLPRQLLFLAISVAAGCYMVYSGNEHGYYNVMKRAPPVGTLWVWSVVEMQLPFAVISVAIVLGYLWYGGYKAF